MKSAFTHEELAVARVLFQNKILTLNAQAYEDFFTSVMQKIHPDFRKIKPQGKIGDQGNDGYIPSTGTYYQCYAPESPKDSVAKASKKLDKDFLRIKSNWDDTSQIREYYFVFNDKYSGAYPKIEHALAKVKNDHELEKASPFLAKDLEELFFELSDQGKNQVLNMVIPRSEYIQNVDFGVLTDVLQHIVRADTVINEIDALNVPDFEEKMEFNDIKIASSYLKVGNYQNGELEIYFNQNGEFSRKQIRDQMARLYEESKGSELLEADTSIGDRVFFRLLKKIAPEQTRQVQDAAIVLISYFFEKCDIYEDPSYDN